MATPAGVLLLSLRAKAGTLASLVGALSLDPGAQSPAAELQRSALHPDNLAQAAAGPTHSHFRPPWGERGAAVGLPLQEHASRIAVPLHAEQLERRAPQA